MTFGESGPLCVAHVIPNGDVGGAQEYLASLAAHHAELGVRPLIITANRGPFIDRYRNAAEVVFVPELNARLRPIRHARALGAVRRLLVRRSIHLIHGHTSRGLVHAALLRRLLGKPAVVSIHGFNSAHALMPPIGAWLATAVKSGAARRVDALTVAAQAIRKVVVQLGVPQDRVHVVYAGIDVERFHPADSLPGHPIRIGAAGRLISIKGFRTYIEAACIVLDNGVAADFELYGDGPEEPALRAIVASKGYAQRITFHPFRRDFAEVLRSWDIAVVPSLVDSFPFVPLEAMATGIPVVASAVGGIPEAVNDGVDGLLVPPGDAARLARSLHRLVENRELRRELGSAGVSKIRQKYTWTRAAHDYLQIYEHILGSAAICRSTRWRRSS